MQRRDFTQKAAKAAIAALAAIAASGCALPRSGPSAAASDAPAARFRQRMQAIEQASGGRLGVAVRDTHSGAAFAHRGGERFPLCSTFKFLAAAQVLARVDSGAEQLDRRIAVLASDLVPYAPVTQPRVGGEPMTVAELCDAAVTLSDNVAGNLLLRSFGGPAALTAYLRGLGDGQTRLDRIEPELNQALPGDPRDTTTPEAMLQTLHRIVLGDALSPPSRAQITRWLVDNKTGDRKIRAALPAGWRVGDKTGAGAFGTNNDIAVLWPPGRLPMLPVLVTAYLTDTSADQAVRDQALAEVGRLVVALATGAA
ncbi:class A beta-lactamase [Rhodoferax koreense]|uniref:Beta-lactamase n=1 Tax=Rhodoferax koreensis TaxID=1842727 RepID=A0A1P8JQI2_9BURK|nr:class A beta-lactamase [Rhodoferax koreense]APW36000.1 class A beta-lactamase [Rhodoferax koreense]